MHGTTSWVKLIGGLVLVFALFQWLGNALHSDRGQAGLLIGLIIVTATLILQRLFFDQTFAASARAVGLGWPMLRGMVVAVALGVLLVLTLPFFAWITNISVGMQPGWVSMIPGLFAQAGVAEETLFRGYLFGNIRRRHSFWRAALLSSAPFAAVHLFLFLTMPWPIALAALFLSIAMSFPLAYLFELAGGTIWAPAVIHFVIQGAIKVITISGEPSVPLPVVWMAVSAILPFAVFLVPVRQKN